MRETGKKLLPFALLLFLLPAGQAQGFFCLLKDQDKHHRPRIPATAFPPRHTTTAPPPPPIEQPPVNGYLGRSVPPTPPRPAGVPGNNPAHTPIPTPIERVPSRHTR